MNLADIHPGMQLTWYWTPRSYGHMWPVRVTVCRVGRRRVWVDAELPSGGTKRISVRPDRLAPRAALPGWRHAQQAGEAFQRWLREEPEAVLRLSLLEQVAMFED